MGRDKLKAHAPTCTGANGFTRRSPRRRLDETEAKLCDEALARLMQRGLVTP